MAHLYIIEMTSDGEGITEVNLGDILVTFTTRFNYSIGAWTLDIADAQGSVVLKGLMLLPNIDILSPYPEQNESLGGLVLFEQNIGDHLDSDTLGTETKLVWFPPGIEVELFI